MSQYAVFGNPINHSKSPQIHHLFAEQTGIALTYQAKLAPVDQFESYLDAFFKQGGRGANITLPFKEKAYCYCAELTERASLAGAVNTIKYFDDGHCLGDNTDGVGLLSDLQRLNMVTPQSKLLLVGAGGAARGVILPLLDYGCEIVITNRTDARAHRLAEQFANKGQIVSCEQRSLTKSAFDLIINATASALQGEIPALPESLISPKTACYDMFYQTGSTPFLSWATTVGALRCADGLGMLVGQAAHSFYLWHGVMPDVEPVLAQLRRVNATKTAV